MTEAEWLAATDPSPMLDQLTGPSSVEFREHFGRRIPFEGYWNNRASTRKLRLFAAACCRRFWNLVDESHCRRLAEEGERHGGQFNPTGLPPDTCQRAVELAERAADGPVPPEELGGMASAADRFHFPALDYAACFDEGHGPYDAEMVAAGHVAYAVYHACGPDIVTAVRGVVWEATQAASTLQKARWSDRGEGREAEERAAQAGLLRDIFGNPFRHVAFDPAWKTSTVLALTNSIYGDKAFDRLPILADALQDAGCDTPYVLNHCRSGGPHVRGCWVVDLILGRE